MVALRILAVSNFLSDIAEWGWEEAPARRLVFRADVPRLPRPLPLYMPVDADRRLSEALEGSPFRLAADALLLHAPAACGSGSCSISSSTACTRSGATGRG